MFEIYYLQSDWVHSSIYITTRWKLLIVSFKSSRYPVDFFSTSVNSWEE